MKWDHVFNLNIDDFISRSREGLKWKSFLPSFGQKDWNEKPDPSLPRFFIGAGWGHAQNIITPAHHLMSYNEEKKTKHLIQ